MLSKNAIKFINSLKHKKTRAETGLFIMEGDKLVTGILTDRSISVNHLVAVPEWLQQNQYMLHDRIQEISTVTEGEFHKITSFETPAGVMIVLPMPASTYNESDLTGRLSVSLDTIQDPGNLGTIIRTVNWFGIRNVFCSPGCADCFNPKVVQSSMGAVMRVNVHCTPLDVLLESLQRHDHYKIYGSYLEGESLYEKELSSAGMLAFGNESRGIHPSLKSLIDVRLTIPTGSSDARHVESLNVSAAVAVFCSEFFRKRDR